MKFLLPLGDTRLSSLMLIDLAYIIVLLPLIIMLKVPMIAFSLIVIALLFFKKEPASNLLLFFIFLLGVVALYLSLYGAFSFRGLSRLKLFLELLVYILIIVVSMQRLTREINFYLLISPFLFLALSLFFYHGIVMLSYVIFEIFFLLWMILAHRMEGNVIESFRSSMVMFMYSLPWVVILFIFFPRISFEHANYGFKGEVTKRMGHDGTMYLDGNAFLVPSERIVMEVGFEDEIPDARQLYFRGSILYVDKKDHWEPLPPYTKRTTNYYYPTEGKEVNYKVTLYPTQKKWLYMLDMPKREIKDSTLDRDLISTVKNNIEEPIHYAASSSLSDSYKERLDDVTFKASTSYSIEQNPKTYENAQEIVKKYPYASKRAEAVMSFFKTQSLTYSIKRKPLDTNHSTDSFLFDIRRGYCVHFASSFVTMARMADIPARVVTGYKADKSESLNNYLAVKEKNAHAWAELYIEDSWVRYETTYTASNIDLSSPTLSGSIEKQKKQNPFLKKINLYLMYTKYQVETWILYYSHVRQLQLLEYAKKNPSFVFMFILSVIGLILFSFIMVTYFRRPHYSSKALTILQPLLKALNKQGYIRDEKESMHQYLLRVMHDNMSHTQVQHLAEVNRLYEEIVYASKESKEKSSNLKHSVKRYIDNIN